MAGPYGVERVFTTDPGDWNCPNCGDLNFRRNTQCRKCGTPSPNPFGNKPKPGDWICPDCGELQFARNETCRKCGTPNPVTSQNKQAMANGSIFGLNTTRGDWMCPGCGDIQFAKNSECRQCGTPNPNPTNASGSSVMQKPGDWTCPNCLDLQFATRPECRKCGTPNPDPEGSKQAMMEAMGTSSMGSPAGPSNLNRISMPGDWNCPNCGDLVFARASQCRRCGTPKSVGFPGGKGCKGFEGGKGCKGFEGGKGSKGFPTSPGDWHCPNCNDLQFARNTQCRKCGTPKPLGGQPGFDHSSGPQQKLSVNDWHCPNCGDLQFSRNSECRKCGTPRPLVGPGALQLAPGDWVCPACNDVQFAKNTACRKCMTPRPDSEEFSMPTPRLGVPSAASRMGGPQLSGGDWICPNCGDLQFARNAACRKCGTPRPAAGVASQPMAMPRFATQGPANFRMSPGDWVCPNCADVQFAKNIQCRKCGEPKPLDAGDAPMMGGKGGKGGKSYPSKDGDWVCPACGDLQFARNVQCRKCGAPHPGGAEAVANTPSFYDPTRSKPGDWACPGCGDMNFARNDQCRKCGTPNPAPQAGSYAPVKISKPGDWTCPACGDLVFARNAACRKCGMPNPDADAGVCLNISGAAPY